MNVIIDYIYVDLWELSTTPSHSSAKYFFFYCRLLLEEVIGLSLKD